MVEILVISVLLIVLFVLLSLDDWRNKQAAQRAVRNVTQHPEVERLPVLTSKPLESPIQEEIPADEPVFITQQSHENVETKPFNGELSNSVIREPQNNTGDTTMLPTYNTPFHLKFENGHHATAVRVALSTTATTIMEYLGIKNGPALFITGGAGAMTEEDIRRTREIIQAIADFAEENHVTIIDGGTESGIMQMIGDARRSRDYTFTLIGVAPLGRVSYPGYKNPNEEAFLEDSHTHFVLVDGDDWGTESELLVSMANAISEKRSLGVIGVLINGGKITRQDVYLAVSKELPILVLEGSGRFADEVATAFKTGKANQSILRAILAGGDIQLVSTIDGPGAMRNKLEARFKKAAP